MKDKLYRSRRFRVLGGVAGGLATYFNLDPILVRVLVVIMSIFHGFGILLYIILWIVVPEEPFEMAYQTKAEPNDQGEANQQPNPFEHTAKASGSGRIITGVILIGLGVLFFADRIIPAFDFSDIFPVLMVLAGIALIWNSMKK